MSTNLIDLWIYAMGSDFKIALAEIERWIGLAPGDVSTFAKPKSEEVNEPRRLQLPSIKKPDLRELRQLSESRSINRGSFQPYSGHGCESIPDSL
jgi:hypothetical protein